MARLSGFDDKPPEAETKVFRSGNSDAVRLPKGFIDSGMPVKVQKLWNGDVLIVPLKKREWPEGFFESLEPLTDDFEIAPDLPYSAEEDERDGSLFNED